MSGNEGREWRALILALFLVDVLSLLLSAGVAGLVRYEEPILPVTYRALGEQVMLIALYTSLFWAIGWHVGIYARDNLLGGPVEYERVFLTAVYVAVAASILAYLLALPSLPRAWWVSQLVSCVCIACLARFVVRRVAYALRGRGLFTTRVLIAGANDQGIAVARQLLWSPRSGFRVVGFLDDYLPAGTRVSTGDPGDPTAMGVGPGGAGQLQVLGSSNQLALVAAEQGAQEVIVIPQAVSWEGLRTIVASHLGPNGGPKIHLSATLYDMVTASMIPTQRALVPLLTLGSKRLVGMDALLKSAFDRGTGLAMFACLWPAASVLVLLGWLKGVRPALEWRTVAGQGGRPVRFPLLSRAITGRLLLRGIPALLSVLQGRLSLVGPRPIAEEDAGECGEWAALLTAMRPGLTGYWRLLAPEATLEDAAAWDLAYLRNYSIWADLHLLFRSANASLRHGGGTEFDAVRRWDTRPSDRELVPGHSMADGIPS